MELTIMLCLWLQSKFGDLSVCTKKKNLMIT